MQQLMVFGWIVSVTVFARASSSSGVCLTFSVSVSVRAEDMLS